jgi:hypothetical protein
MIVHEILYQLLLKEKSESIQEFEECIQHFFPHRLIQFNNFNELQCKSIHIVLFNTGYALLSSNIGKSPATLYKIFTFHFLPYSKCGVDQAHMAVGLRKISPL